jgi:hypothetical protein
VTLVLFERPDGSPVYINPAAVVSVSNSTSAPGQTKLTFSSSSSMQVVKGELEEVVARLRGDPP